MAGREPDRCMQGRGGGGESPPRAEVFLMMRGTGRGPVPFPDREALAGAQFLTVPHLFGLGQHGQEPRPGMLLQEIGILLQLAAHV